MTWLVDPKTREPLPAFQTERKYMEDVARRRLQAAHWRPRWRTWMARGPDGKFGAMYFAQCFDPCCVSPEVSP